MIRRVLYYSIAVLAAVLIVLEAVAVSFFAMAFRPAFFKNSFRENNTADLNSHDLSEEQLLFVIKDVLAYLWGDGRVYLDTTVEGLDRPVFIRDDEDPGQPEQAIQVRHMKDVKNLTVALKILMFAGIGLIPLLLVCMRVLNNRKRETYKKLFLGILIGVGAFIAVLGVAMAVDFERTFEIFHKILFTNDDWILRYDDMLIEMLPESLFMGLGFRIAGMFFGLIAAVSALVFCQGPIGRGFTRLKGKFFQTKKPAAPEDTAGNV